MLNVILTELSKVQIQHGVQILYACEAGSRAWGFASADSDYDVRFIYVHPPSWYLSILDRRDVIELPPGHLDINGWDLRKALRLYRKSNPPLMEWLMSPIVYMLQTTLHKQLWSLLPKYYSPTHAAYHYLHMALGNYREYLKGPDVWLKKYLYVIRPLLAVRYIEAGGWPVPTVFGELLDATVTGPVADAILDLVGAKRAGSELGRGPKIPVISDFISSELARLEGTRFDKAQKPPPADQLDTLFREILQEVWSPSQ